MIRRDFIMKIIEQLVDIIARMLRMDHILEPKEYIDAFEEAMKTYYKISSDELDLLLDAEEERDLILGDEKLKNFQLRMFTNAGMAYHQSGARQKAGNCLKIIQKIRTQTESVFEFPTEENRKINEEIEKLESLLGMSFISSMDKKE